MAGGLILAGLSWRLDLGHWKMPGPGAWPFLLALTTAFIGGWLFFRPQPSTQKTFVSQPRWKPWILSLLTLFGYVILLERLGYLISTIFLLSIQLSGVENRRWSSSIIIAITAAVVSFLIFGIFLKVPLPPGILPLRIWG